MLGYRYYVQVYVLTFNIDLSISDGIPYSCQRNIIQIYSKILGLGSSKIFVTASPFPSGNINFKGMIGRDDTSYIEGVTW